MISISFNLFIGVTFPPSVNKLCDNLLSLLFVAGMNMEASRIGESSGSLMNGLRNRLPLWSKGSHQNI